MAAETIFHLAFIFVFLAFFGIRIAYHRMAFHQRGQVEYRESKLNMGLRLIIGASAIGLIFAYMFQPGILAWAELSLPPWTQWIGLVLGLASIPLGWWVQWALGSNFSTTLHLREHHTLVTHGPYRWVRHPMYTVLHLFGLGIFLLTGNAFIGFFMLVPLTLIVLTRIHNEEAVMLEKFGSDYQTYMQRTGRFLPRLVRKTQ